MAKPELTKLLIAETLKMLVEHMPLDKITVQDIVKTCGINRKTFYYHFHDKQALICWIFDYEIANLTRSSQDNMIINNLAEHLYENKNFYIAALTSNVQNNLRDHMFKIAYDIIMNKISGILGSREMSSNSMKMIANYFTNATIGCITQWASEGMKTPLDEYNFIFYPMTQDCLEFIVEKYCSINEKSTVDHDKRVK
ncbi:TetR/AcrR family transcriptional regulator C-terminal domain-containing protein [Lutispora thermophila]|uniref:Transcriptional regulator, TetR family n=1 Tax=Lutispora thermophila DSM 19022 TaxID=1122184 RepID=A0A1M6FKN0_9FIRM|nr:TetR/AcrR family transcriptional regulator C-terminal domain-containing protein [Lutispora thermophila]SHI98192.1 transcriptional regulator, TetR family [Lutispora thermophila DSM 19022]